MFSIDYDFIPHNEQEERTVNKYKQVINPHLFRYTYFLSYFVSHTPTSVACKNVRPLLSAKIDAYLRKKLLVGTSIAVKFGSDANFHFFR